MEENQYLTPEEIAKVLRVHPKTVREWLREGALKGLRLKGLWRVPTTEFEKFISQSLERGKDKT